MLKRVAPLLLLAALLSGFRSFPALSEPDPDVVFSQFQSALEGASTVEDLFRYISHRKQREYARKQELAANPAASDRLIETLKHNFFLMHPALAAKELHPDTALLVYKGAVNLNGIDYVEVTMGVMLVKEDGAWKVDRDKITYRRSIERDGAEIQETGRMAF
ncbi:MAG: hypothetical protein JWM80_1465 [Cyanobacteria bacterium RYN_339]|nr:hypothetical protein [Cyanobacteria bacterium RYN_339]